MSLVLPLLQHVLLSFQAEIPYTIAESIFLVGLHVFDELGELGRGVGEVGGLDVDDVFFLDLRDDGVGRAARELLVETAGVEIEGGLLDSVER